MNPFEPEIRARGPAVLGETIVNPTGWSNRDFSARDSYLFVLFFDEIDEIMGAADQLEQKGNELKGLNHVGLHGRTAYQDWPEPEKKRPIHDTIVQDLSGIKLSRGTNPNTSLDMTPVV